MATNLNIEGVKQAPRIGDLFTYDYRTFYKVMNPAALIPDFKNGGIYISVCVDWKEAMPKSTDMQVWEANGDTPILVWPHNDNMPQPFESCSVCPAYRRCTRG
jgi:hypothetical protein